ncbi:serine hydrolase domain-containing protein [Sediminibacterium ginsengisoli]|uniref:CubicO group peptidase, beta-lactamase class C family n=1 Tax=Sediminibacterium ginsengisoli TaxID=413434 RepID=A0A1T4NJU8_9BACT|nr:serine hydrolase domain-containing protein [Sediminibacterium ginsengisoli]SJZ79542.1 CubicO group peptidase, beta-lactamase class C family [Sediminibacterium ginsengisoli]
MRFYLLSLLLVCSLATSAQKKGYEAVDSLMQSVTADNGFSGVVLIAEKGKVRYEKAFGYRSFATQQPLQTTDIFEIASVSKQFTTMIIMMLEEKGALQFDDPVEKYLTLPYKGITIRHLLTHTSGLPDYLQVMDQHWDKSKVAGNDDIISYLNTYAPPVLFQPGDKYQYSNTGYVLLASIAEKAGKEDFITQCRKKIFRKLGMKSTDIRTAAEKALLPNLAYGHIYVPAKGTYVSADSFPAFNYTIWLGNRKGPGRISSTVQDLLRWDRALYTRKLVKQETLQQAFTPMKLNDGKISNYGFGWVIAGNPVAGKVVQHNGDNPGYKTEIIRFIDLDRTIIVLTNNAPEKFGDITASLKKIVSAL